MRSVALLAAAGLFLALLVALSPVQAHAEYVSSEPRASAVLETPPDRVVVHLSEPAQPGSATLRVTNETGDRFDDGSVVIHGDDPRTVSVGVRPLPPGVYTASWSVVSAFDGHFTAGSFSFGVLAPDGTLPGALPDTPPTAEASLSPVEVVLRFGSFLGLATALGVLAFATLVWRPAWFRRASLEEVGYREGLRRLLRTAWMGAVAFAVAVGGWWALALARVPPTTIAGTVATPFLLSLASRVGFGVALALLLVPLVRRTSRSSGIPGTRSLMAALALGCGAVAASVLGSHGFALRALWPLGGVAHGVHLLGAALWVGGLFAFLRVRSTVAAPPGGEVSSEVLQGLSRLALASVALVLVTGAALAALLVGSVEALVGTTYGWAVLAKALLILPMVALGAHNRVRLLPRFPDAPTPSVVPLVRNVRAEALLGVALLLVAGVLTALNPGAGVVDATPRDVLTLETTTDDLRLRVQVTPYPTGPGVYTFELLVWDAGGAAYMGARNATLTFTLRGSTLPPETVPMAGPHANHFFVDTTALSRSGSWDVDVRFARVDGFDVRATFLIEVGGSG